MLIKPEELQANGITVQKVVQHPGDFIINFPGKHLHVCAWCDVCMKVCARALQQLQRRNRHDGVFTFECLVTI